MNGAYVPALESIEAVNIVTNSFDAEQGLAGGAAISVQIKSGTNHFHGSAFEYHDNSAFRSRGYFLPAGQDKAKLVYHQTGGTIGGPIKRDKLFFFTSLERTSDRQSANLITRCRPGYVRNGDFSGFSALFYDPFTGKADGSGRTPFPGTRFRLTEWTPSPRRSSRWCLAEPETGSNTDRITSSSRRRSLSTAGPATQSELGHFGEPQHFRALQPSRLQHRFTHCVRRRTGRARSCGEVGCESWGQRRHPQYLGRRELYRLRRRSCSMTRTSVSCGSRPTCGPRAAPRTTAWMCSAFPGPTVRTNTRAACRVSRSAATVLTAFGTIHPLLPRRRPVPVRHQCHLDQEDP